MTTPGATVEEHQYPHGSGKTFYLATCREQCHALLNSGHHYAEGLDSLEQAKAFAQAEVDRHNAEWHAA